MADGGAFRQAIEHDPKYALALAGLADTHILLGIYQLVPPNDAVGEALHDLDADPVWHVPTAG